MTRAAAAILAALLFPMLLALLAGLGPRGAAWLKGLVLELGVLVPALIAAIAAAEWGAGVDARLALALVPLAVAPWMALFVYLNFDACRRPNLGLLLVAALAYAGGELAVGQTRYGVKWRADYGGGYVRNEFLTGPPNPARACGTRTSTSSACAGATSRGRGRRGRCG